MTRLALAFLFLAGCSADIVVPPPAAPAPVATGASARPRSACPKIAANIVLAPESAVVEEISIAQLELLLPRHPVVVGFDVDDTLVFSAPAFNALQPQYDPDVIRPKSYDALSADARAKYHEFWNRLNTEYDDRSIPKAIGKRLLALHIARHDEIWVISKRQGIVPPPAVDVVTKRYERMFDVVLAHPVVQTELSDKTPFLCERAIDYYYGDADGDVTASIAAGATPIRVKRSTESYAKDAVHNGRLGEIVLKDSDR